jgi:hypothetical protein
MDQSGIERVSAFRAAEADSTEAGAISAPVAEPIGRGAANLGLRHRGSSLDTGRERAGTAPHPPAVAIFAIAIFKHYFPTVSLHTTADGGSKPEPDQSEADEVVEGPLGELRATEQRMLQTMASLQAGGPALIVMGRKFAKTRHRLLHRKPRRRGHES